ncbi:nucleotide exchange factor GrpE [Paenalcaligenes niemegkensis]|uniref:nucleotide exchange factor GrpE n=1 Tax=Paenalcaligenes niemegkensis TaxID=2895469 RepID=UPI001EE94467|nr:nucleotide exchange factor GrpE [Paenalcaligenes niemegkensis]MCQ9617004.1 nucleotide exchange factor GrpE [Paenalcaligenes niemegkensis]
MSESKDQHENNTPDTENESTANESVESLNEDGTDGVIVEENLEQQLEEAQAKIAQYYDQLLRAKAEVENIRRRAEDEVSKARKFGAESFAESLLPVRDSLEAALAQGEQTVETFREGVETTLRQIDNAFTRNQLKEVAPAPGDKFDPHLHQAMSSVPSEHPQGTIEQTLQKGYLLADRVLRPALVMVSAG